MASGHLLCLSSRNIDFFFFCADIHRYFTSSGLEVESSMQPQPRPNEMQYDISHQF